MSETTYSQLKTAIAVFRNYGVSDEDIKNSLDKVLDKSFMEGFKTARSLVESVLDCHDEDLVDDIKVEIEDALDNFKRDE